MKGSKLSKIAIWSLGIGVLLILLTPILLTRDFGLLSFASTGQIGDTIGGISSPIVSLVGSILVYLALKAQIEANEQIQQQIQKQEVAQAEADFEKNILELLQLIRAAINDFTILETKSTQIGLFGGMVKINEKTQVEHLVHKGAYAIENYTTLSLKKTWPCEFYPVYRKEYRYACIYNILLELKLLIKSIEDKVEISTLKKHSLTQLVRFQFLMVFIPSFDDLDSCYSYANEVCPKCSKKHTGIPIEILDLIRELITYFGLFN